MHLITKITETFEDKFLLMAFFLSLRSYLGIPANSWVDDYIDWLNPGSKCCRLFTTIPNFGQFCPATERENHF